MALLIKFLFLLITEIAEGVLTRLIEHTAEKTPTFFGWGKKVKAKFKRAQ